MLGGGGGGGCAGGKGEEEEQERRGGGRQPERTASERRSGRGPAGEVGVRSEAEGTGSIPFSHENGFSDGNGGVSSSP